MEPGAGRRRHARMRLPASLSLARPGRGVAAVLLIALVAVVAACGGSSAASPLPSAPAGVATPEEAVARIRATSPLFDGIEEQDPDLIGGSAWWTAAPIGPADAPTGWTIVFEVGWGDCPAGCIDRHTWTYEVTTAGDVSLVAEAGSPLLEEIQAGLYASAQGTGVGGRVLAGPTCPVEDPDDPSCAGRTVPGATLTVATPGGEQVASLVTDASGFYRVADLAPGEYVLTASAVEGLMGTPGPAPFTVRADEVTRLDVLYDTGIR